ncbi:POU domain, class 6, transcription factor 2-like [Macrobrachium nipponense]|uniref:POU domain, class 6, transcription factor 2-like n=1 Tax=Macrobrachium nipponense TaxID=159736 RepID=UPI0030C84B4E
MKGSPPPTTEQQKLTQYTSHSQPPTTQQEPQRDLAKQWQHPIQQHTHKPPQSHRPQHYQQTHKTGPQSQKTQHHQPPTQTQKQQATPTKPHENRDPRLTEGTLYTQRNTQVPNARPTSFLPYSTPKQSHSVASPSPFIVVLRSSPVRLPAIAVTYEPLQPNNSRPETPLHTGGEPLKLRKTQQR